MALCVLIAITQLTTQIMRPTRARRRGSLVGRGALGVSVTRTATRESRQGRTRLPVLELINVAHHLFGAVPGVVFVFLLHKNEHRFGHLQGHNALLLRSLLALQIMQINTEMDENR